MPLLLCPNCQAGMQQVSREGVQIDICTQCRGVWLDRGELEKLLGTVRQADREWQDERQYFHDKYKHHDDDYYRKHKHKKGGLNRFLDIFD